MSNTIQSPPPVVVTPTPSQTFDPKDIVEAANGIISGDGKGFMPLTDFPPTKPYEDWQAFLEKQRDILNQDRERLLAEDPRTFFEEQARKLEVEKNRLEQRCESNFEARLSDLEQRYVERMADQATYYSYGIARREEDIGKLDAKIKILEDAIKSLEERCITNNDLRIEEHTRHYEARIADMERYRDELSTVYVNANEQAWKRSREIEECIQARESGCMISGYFKRNFWNSFIGKWVIIILSISCIGLILALIHKYIH